MKFPVGGIDRQRRRKKEGAVSRNKRPAFCNEEAVFSSGKKEPRQDRPL